MPSHTQSKSYAESTYSTSTTYSEKPIMLATTFDKPASKRAKAWQKTKDFLAKIPVEPPQDQRATYARPETEEEQLKRLRKFGELDYGTYQAGPFCGHAARH